MVGLTSAFEIAVALNALATKEMDVAHVASIISGNLAGLNDIDTSGIWRSVKGVGYGLEDETVSGRDDELHVKVNKLKKELNKLILSSTEIFLLPRYLDEISEFKNKLHMIVPLDQNVELRHTKLDNLIYLCNFNDENLLKSYKKFNSYEEFEDQVWML